MSPFIAFILGMLTILIIIIPFWVMSMRVEVIAKYYNYIFCNQSISTESTSTIS